VILWAYESPTTGEVVDLSSDALDELGVLGAVGAEFEVQSEQLPIGHGEVVRGVRARPRTITVPLLVKDPQGQGWALDDRLARLALELSPLSGAGRLIATRADDEGQPILDAAGRPRSRAIEVLYTGGIDVRREWGDDYGGWWQTGALLFYAAQPFWQRTRPESYVFGNDEPLPWFPWFPELAAGSLLGAVEVVNDGATDAYPVWTVTSPGASVTIRNVSTGQAFTVATAATEGQDLIVDTRPTWLGGGRSVYRTDCTSLYRHLSGPLWTLPRGRNQLELDVATPTLNTTVRLEFSPLDLTP
jgi:hypothetical protein